MSKDNDLESMIRDFKEDTELTPELKAYRRKRICDFEIALKTLPDSIPAYEINEQVEHHFATGVYGREMVIPEGQVIVSKIHKNKTFNIIAHGFISVISEEGFMTCKAPYCFVSEPMTKRIVIAHKDTVWVTAQGSHQTDFHKLESELVAKDFKELEGEL